MAFFVGKNGSSDGIDAFVTAVLNTGFGSGEEAAQVEVLQRIFQVCFLRTRVLVAAGLQGVQVTQQHLGFIKWLEQRWHRQSLCI